MDRVQSHANALYKVQAIHFIKFDIQRTYFPSAQCDFRETET